MEKKITAPRNDEHLPSWFVKPSSCECLQSTLFPEDVQIVLARLRVSSDELDRWRQKGWISFDSNPGLLLEPHHIDELVFVRDLVRSGIPDAYQEMLFKQLPKPLRVNPNMIAFSFSHGWVLPAITDEPELDEYMEQNIDSWLEQLAEEEQGGRLLELRGKIDELLSRIPFSSK